MGITGLLPLLKQIQEPTSLARYKGETLAVDTYAWLHKSVLACTMELAQDRPTNKYISYVLRRIDMLQHFGITPFLVFDGDYLPCKSNTEVDRELRRKEHQRLGELALKRGDSKLAFSSFQKSCDITPAMAKLLIDVLKKRGIKYVVAPYEADSQMVYLEKMGIVDGIISEDSDLLVFGCKRLITKLNDRGECVEINRANFKKCRQVPVHYLTPDQFILVAALSGCDYTKGIPGIGIIKAFALVKRYGTLEKVLAAMKLEGKFKVPEGFAEEAERAKYSFQYQLVFDPISKALTHLSELPDVFTPVMKSCSGEKLDDAIHHKIAIGELHPIEKTQLVSREETLLSKNSTVAIRTNSLYQGRSPGFTPVKVASRAFSTPMSQISSKSKTIDSFFSSVTKMKSQEEYMTPVSIKRLKVTSSPSQLMTDFKGANTTKDSPIAKRKKLLHGDANSNGQLLTSKFFTNTKDLKLEGGETQEVADVDKSSQDSSTEFDDFHEDSHISESFLNEEMEPNHAKGGVKTHHEGCNSSDFDLDELSESEDGGEGQELLTQTQHSSRNVSEESIIKSLTEKLDNSAHLNLEKDFLLEKGTVSYIESPTLFKTENPRLGLKEKFAFQSRSHVRGNHNVNASPLQNTTPSKLNRMGTSSHEYKSNKTQLKQAKSLKSDPTNQHKFKSINLDSFKFIG